MRFFNGLVPALDLALGLWVSGSTVNLFDRQLFEPFDQLARELLRPTVIEALRNALESASAERIGRQALTLGFNNCINTALSFESFDFCFFAP